MGQQLIIASFLKVQLKDLRNCSGYLSNCNCLLATAGKRQFKTDNVVETVYGMTIDGNEYEHKIFTVDEYHRLQNKYRNSNVKPSTVILTLPLCIY